MNKINSHIYFNKQKYILRIKLNGYHFAFKKMFPDNFLRYDFEKDLTVITFEPNIDNLTNILLINE